MEDQVTYPITSALLGMPKVKDIRGFSDFGYSYIYIIFDEGTDIYWARSRTLEYLNSVLRDCPRASTSSWRKMPPPSAGSISTRWSIPLGSTASSRCGAIRTGICAMRCSRCRGLPRLRRSADLCGSTRSTSIPTSCSATRSRSTWWCDAMQKVEQRCRRAAGRIVRPRIHGARARLHQIARRHRQASLSRKPADRHAGAGPRRRAR